MHWFLLWDHIIFKDFFWHCYLSCRSDSSAFQGLIKKLHLQLISWSWQKLVPSDVPAVLWFWQSFALNAFSSGWRWSSMAWFVLAPSNSQRLSNSMLLVAFGQRWELNQKNSLQEAKLVQFSLKFTDPQVMAYPSMGEKACRGGGHKLTHILVQGWPHVIKVGAFPETVVGAIRGLAMCAPIRVYLACIPACRWKKFHSGLFPSWIGARGAARGFLSWHVSVLHAGKGLSGLKFFSQSKMPV